MSVNVSSDADIRIMPMSSVLLPFFWPPVSGDSHTSVNELGALAEQVGQVFVDLDLSVGCNFIRVFAIIARASS